MFNRLHKFFIKSNKEKLKTIDLYLKTFLSNIFYIKSIFFNIYIQYLPDFYTTFNHNKEFKILYKKYIRKNRKNNSGDIVRLWLYILNCQRVIENNVDGDFAELGVWRGNTASVLAHYAKQSNKSVDLFDTFEGFSEKDLHGHDAAIPRLFNNTSVAMVKNNIGEDFNVCNIYKGYFPDSFPNFNSLKKYSIVSLDCDLLEPMSAGLEIFYPLVSPGGLIIVHDYHNPHFTGVKVAVDNFCNRLKITPVMMPDKAGTVIITKL
jgi:hypothetical protein